MSGGFLIIPRNVTLFRVKVSGIRCELDKAYTDAEDLYVDGDFDMFRTFSTSKEAKSKQSPEWPEYEVMFIYQTEYVEMLIAKRFKLALNCTLSSSAKESGLGIVGAGCCGGQFSTDFIGEAEVDLMTIATGPETIVLTLRNGEIVVGSIFVKVEMEEISEMRAEIKNVVFTPEGNHVQFNFPPSFDISKKGRQDPLHVKGVPSKGADGSSVRGSTSYDVPMVIHHFSTSLPDISESAGLVIDVCNDGWLRSSVVGTVEIDFYNHLWMIDEHRDPNGLRKKASVAEKEKDDAERKLGKLETAFAAEEHKGPSPLLDSLKQAVEAQEAVLKRLTETHGQLAKDAAAAVGKEPGYGWFKFLSRDPNSSERKPLTVKNGDGRVIGTMAGECHLTYMPRYCQMRAGTTVDGVVCNGIMYQFATIEPPFKSKVHRLEVDDGNYA